MAEAKEFHSKSIQAVVASTVGLMIGPTSVISIPLGLFLLPVTQEFGIGQGVFFLIMGLAAATGSLIAPFAGRAMDRWGVRRVAIPGVAAFALAEMALSRVGHGALPVFIALYFGVGLTAGVQNPIAYAKVVSQWFSRKRGLVLALTSAIGGGGGAAIAPQLAKHFIDEGGWRQGYFALGAYVAILGLPMLLLFLKEPARAAAKAGGMPGFGPMGGDVPGLSQKEAFRVPAYLMVIGSLFLAVGSMVIISAMGPSILQSRGLDMGANFLSVGALGLVLGQILSGVLLDRINSPRVAIPFMACAVIGSMGILHLGTSVPIVLAFAFVMGLGQGAEVGLAAYFVSRYCGLKAYGALFGTVYGATVAAAGLGPVMAGLVFDKIGDYGPIIIAIDIALVISLILIAILPPYTFAAAKGMVSTADEAVDAGDPVPQP